MRKLDDYGFILSERGWGGSYKSLRIMYNYNKLKEIPPKILEHVNTKYPEFINIVNLVRQFKQMFKNTSDTYPKVLGYVRGNISNV